RTAFLRAGLTDSSAYDVHGDDAGEGRPRQVLVEHVSGHRLCERGDLNPAPLRAKRFNLVGSLKVVARVIFGLVRWFAASLQDRGSRHVTRGWDRRSARRSSPLSYPGGFA